MSAKKKALVIEDDSEIRDEIEDVLGILRHDHDWAESQQEALELAEANHYDYVLADLEIPARPGRGFAKIEYGKKLITQIQQLKGRGATPVLVMTGHHQHGLNLALELLGDGVMDFISKPFGDGTQGKSLPQAIQRMLEKHRKMYRPGTLPGDPPMPFAGGTLAFYPDHVELDGETILDHGCAGHAWDVLQVLRTPRPNGKLPYLSAPRLARTIDTTGQLSDGAINSCIHTLRTKITQTMLDKANVTVGRDDVIANGGRGYHLAEWVQVEVHGDGQQTSDADRDVVAVGDSMPDRQQWILDRLLAGKAMTRSMVEKQFGIGKKQAKRELSVLTGKRAIRFVRKPHPGHYVLCDD